jgi:hypothetical protein
MSDKDIKSALHQEIDRLATLRDELKVKLALAKQEVQQEWGKLEGTWDNIQDEVKLVGEQSKEPAQQISAGFRALLDQLKHGYDQIRSQLK